MVKSALYAAIGFAAISSIALAEDLSSATAPLPPGTFTTSAHSDEWKIANALSAGPPSITEHRRLGTSFKQVADGSLIARGSPISLDAGGAQSVAPSHGVSLAVPAHHSKKS
jgi:hypothetical protein